MLEETAHLEKWKHSDAALMEVKELGISCDCGFSGSVCLNKGLTSNSQA